MAGSIALQAYLALRRGGRKDTGAVPSPATWPDRPRGPLVWFHVPSEIAVRPIEELLTRLDQASDTANALITIPGLQSPQFMQIGDAQIISVAPPEDTRAEAQEFLEHWAPDVCLWSRGHLRPAVITTAHEANVPLFLIDASLSGIEQRWLPGMTRSLLRCFSRHLAVDFPTSQRLRALGAHPYTIEAIGALQEGSAALPCNEAEREFLAEGLASRPTWLATALPQSEIDLTLQAHLRALRRTHRLLLFVDPADQASSEAVIKAARAKGLAVGVRTLEDEPHPDMQVFVADIPGELGLWYRLAPVSYMGGTFTGSESRNPFEPASLGSAIVHGPSVVRHRGGFQRLDSAGATRILLRSSDLGDAVGELLSPDASAQLAHAAWDVASSGAEVTDRVIGLIAGALETREMSG